MTTLDHLQNFLVILGAVAIGVIVSCVVSFARGYARGWREARTPRRAALQRDQEPEL